MLGVYDRMHPCYTVFHPERETFTNLWTEYHPDCEAFCAAYRRDVDRYGANPAFEGTPENIFPVSMLPWAGFDGFHLCRFVNSLQERLDGNTDP